MPDVLVDPHAVQPPARRVQPAPQHVLVEHVGPAALDAGQVPHLGVPAVGADDAGGHDAARSPARGAAHPGHPGAVADQAGDPMAGQVGEAGLGGAPVVQLFEHVPLRDAEQMVVRWRQHVVSDAEQGTAVVDELEAGQLVTAAGPRAGEHPELIEHREAARLQDLAAVLPLERSGPLRHHDGDARPGQEQGQGQAGRATADDADVGVQGVARVRRAGLAVPP